MSHHHNHQDHCCGSCGCGDNHHHHHHHPHGEHECCEHHHHAVVEKDFAHQLLEMADEAWMEILKDKIKEQILSTDGSNLEELAKMVSQTNHDRWKHKIATNATVHEYREKFSSFFDKK
ncbi:hypothetical protein [Parachlamydia sp. AcF125]|uniref:hypothetical protein n=1 Tax=Parachlamydia sp. AcF125 TaxID=2795736 RepID=UPI001BC95A10|nr:hypothetical protein [Parachlamydia sp. AcF125]MBS4168536.1 hypothetical protein [Parachlamydia sp. AcF125]